MIRARTPLVSLLVLLAPYPLSAAEQPLIVEDGNDVSIEYTLSTPDGTIVNSNIGGAPFTYRQGVKSLECMAGVQKRLVGRNAGVKVSMVLPPEEACGPADPNAVMELELEVVPKNSRQPGRNVKVRGPHGIELVGVVKEVKEKTAVIDINHPLAGKTLHFDVTILTITRGDPQGAPPPRPPDTDYR
jgi:FKBP-type peptidyl-prolyl cis-trans isomerase SlyD